MKNHLAIALAAVFVAAPLEAQTLTGPATVIDGDTIDMTGTRIRLLGIDAPESAQGCTREGQPWACGEEATNSLREIVEGQRVRCMAQGVDVYGRTLATCEAAGIDIAREAARRGMAIALDNAPEDYHAAVNIARQFRHGMWAGEFEQPSAWRAANPRSDDRNVRLARSERPAAAPVARPAAPRRYTNAQGCAIKGNHSRHGDFIYHLPGQKYYNQTRPEALFCTEREAQAAGFRRSKE